MCSVCGNFELYGLLGTVALLARQIVIKTVNYANSPTICISIFSGSFNESSAPTFMFIQSICAEFQPDRRFFGRKSPIWHLLYRLWESSFPIHIRRTLAHVFREICFVRNWTVETPAESVVFGPGTPAESGQFSTPTSLLAKAFGGNYPPASPLPWWSTMFG